jgi:hypothetical protein
MRKKFIGPARPSVVTEEEGAVEPTKGGDFRRRYETSGRWPREPLTVGAVFMRSSNSTNASIKPERLRWSPWNLGKPEAAPPAPRGRERSGLPRLPRLIGVGVELPGSVGGGMIEARDDAAGEVPGPGVGLKGRGALMVFLDMKFSGASPEGCGRGEPQPFFSGGRTIPSDCYGREVLSGNGFNSP